MKAFLCTKETGHPNEIRELTFRALALFQSVSRIRGLYVDYIASSAELSYSGGTLKLIGRCH